ncbi:MAG: DNA mismatch repair protein MutS [Fibrobacterales bacterium]
MSKTAEAPSKKLTPMMRQYLDIKANYSDCVLFYRMGDFYELFNEDAIFAAKILGITLTSRNSKDKEPTPLCGFPYHAAERYIPKMIQAGHKVAICEQMEDPKDAVGIVKRDVIEVITAGTNLNESTLDAKSSNYLVGIYMSVDPSVNCSLAALDISTGTFFVAEGTAKDIENELFRIGAKEVLVNEETALQFPFVDDLKENDKVLVSILPDSYFTIEEANTELCKQFKVETLESFGIEKTASVVIAAGAVLLYALDLKKTSLDHLDRIEVHHLADYMVLDGPTIRNLELLKPLNNDDTSSTLISVLDNTITAMGGRKLKHWVSHPLVNKNLIHKRLDAVEEVFESQILQEDLKLELREINDIERLIGRIGSGRANARDLQALGRSLLKADNIGSILNDLKSPIFAHLQQSLSELGHKGEYILDLLNDDLPLTLREGKMICRGANEKLDALNEGIREAREWLAGLEAREKERLKIPTLKVGFNKVFGYYLETTKQHIDKIPDTYIRKQTLANAERFITPEMKEYETKILNAESQINQLEYQIFTELRNEANGWCSELRSVADDIASVDSLYSLALAARKQNFMRPSIKEGTDLDIHGGWHPVITKMNPDITFIRNDVDMDAKGRQIMLITGPNMAGKSTYLRQTGIIVLLAQIGSFVSAEKAEIGICDRIFTRVGASDRLSKGQSTFMVEMIETANILNNATAKSLILLDEIGRGTSTFDGLSLAWAIVETLHNEPAIAGKTLFATHYHELSSLEESLKRVENYHISVKEQQGSLLFLRKIKKGPCDSSYGIQVAGMAGVPKNVILRAKKILLRLESKRTVPLDASFDIEEKPQQDLFEPEPMTENHKLLINDLAKADLNNMTPMGALQFVAELKESYL